MIFFNFFPILLNQVRVSKIKLNWYEKITASNIVQKASIVPFFTIYFLRHCWISLDKFLPWFIEKIGSRIREFFFFECSHILSYFLDLQKKDFIASPHTENKFFLKVYRQNLIQYIHGWKGETIGYHKKNVFGVSPVENFITFLSPNFSFIKN